MLAGRRRCFLIAAADAVGFLERALHGARALRLDALGPRQLIDVGERHRRARRPDDLRLELRVRLFGPHQHRGVDLALRQVLARLQPEDVEAARDLGSVDVPVEPVRRPVAARDELLAVDRPAIEKGDLDRVRRVGEVEHRDAALIPRLHHDVAAGHRDERAVVRHAILLLGLRRRHLEVAAEPQLAIDNVEDRVGAPRDRIGRAAPGPSAAAPLVGEDHLRSVVVECR